ncbi:hypothetical protein PT974_01892 [Cladobotryum mycophilum]|uniref:C2H2-type domain-containing protein n=1 Tax=Cladobotryum mycophilum TaxID=491253 RepID=A0ABR0SXR1_9HYPO
MQNIDMILAQLAQIAVTVRRSSKHSRLQRADQLFKLEEHDDLKTHLSTMLLAHGEFSQEKIDPSHLSEVQQRIVRCNLKRRNRFIYAQRHSKSLGPVAAGHSSRVGIVELIDANPKDADNQNKKETPSIVKTSSEQAKVLVNPTIVSGTRASAVSESLVLPHTSLPAPAASTVVSSTVIDIKYPQPPKVMEGAHVFTCPCCCQTLPVALSEGIRWKKHIADDLMPYTCILPGCAHPEVLYATKKEWRHHLINEHYGFEYWVCFSCGGATQFRSQQDFITHTTTEHSPSIPSSEIPLLADICKRSAPVEITSCPLCKWPEDEEEVDKNMLLDHIAKDLHAFSLRSLPWNDDNGQETEDRIRHSREMVYSWLGNGLSENPTMILPPLDEKVYDSNHFQQNPYFADSLASSSSSRLESAASWEDELKKWKQKEGSISFGSHQSKARGHSAAEIMSFLGYFEQRSENLNNSDRDISDEESANMRDIYQQSKLFSAAREGNSDVINTP